MTEPAVDATPEPERAPRAALVALALALLALLAVCIATPLWPMHDGPQHALMAHVEANFGDPAQHYERYFVEAPQFAGRGAAPLFLLLEATLGARRAALTAPVLVLVALALSSAALCGSVDRRRLWVGVAAVPLAFSWPFYMGFYPFCVATSVGFALLAAMVRFQRPAAAPRRRPFLTVLFLAGFALAATCHAFAAFLTAAVFVALVTLGGDGIDAPETASRALGKRLGWALLVTAPAVLILAATALVSTERLSQTLPTPSYDHLPQRILQAPRMGAPGPALRGWFVALAAVGGVAWALSRRAKSRPTERALALCAAAFLAVAALAPLNLGSWNYFAPRFLPLGFLCGLSLVPVERARSGPALAALAAAALFWWPARYQRTLASQLGDAWSGLSQPARVAGPRLAVLFDPPGGYSWPPAREVPESWPLLSLGELYASVQGGVVRSMFRGNSAVHAQLDAPGAAALYPPEPDPRVVYSVLGTPRERAERGFIADLYAASATRFSDVILYALPDAHARFVSRGFERTFASGRLAMYRFRGCPLSVEVRGARRELEVGMFPLAEPHTVVTAEPRSSADEPSTVVLERGPCGDLWVRPTRGICSESSPRRRLRASATAGASAPTRLVCTVVDLPASASPTAPAP